MTCSYRPITISRHGYIRIAQRLGVTDKERAMMMVRRAFKRGVPTHDGKFAKRSNSNVVKIYDGVAYVFKGANRHALLTVYRVQDERDKERDNERGDITQ